MGERDRDQPLTEDMMDSRLTGKSFNLTMLGGLFVRCQGPHGFSSRNDGPSDPTNCGTMRRKLGMRLGRERSEDCICEHCGHG